MAVGLLWLFIGGGKQGTVVFFGQCLPVQIKDSGLAGLAGALAAAMLMHHHPVPPEHADRFPNTIGIRPEHSMRMIDVGSGTTFVHFEGVFSSPVVGF